MAGHRLARVAGLVVLMLGSTQTQVEASYGSCSCFRTAPNQTIVKCVAPLLLVSWVCVTRLCGE